MSLNLDLGDLEDHEEKYPTKVRAKKLAVKKLEC